MPTQLITLPCAIRRKRSLKTVHGDHLGRKRTGSNIVHQLIGMVRIASTFFETHPVKSSDKNYEQGDPEWHPPGWDQGNAHATQPPVSGWQ